MGILAILVFPENRLLEREEAGFCVFCHFPPTVTWSSAVRWFGCIFFERNCGGLGKRRKAHYTGLTRSPGKQNGKKPATRGQGIKMAIPQINQHRPKFPKSNTNTKLNQETTPPRAPCRTILSAIQRLVTIRGAALMRQGTPTALCISPFRCDISISEERC